MGHPDPAGRDKKRRPARAVALKYFVFLRQKPGDDQF